jgi:hypothetical protein
MMMAKVKERLAVSKQISHRFHMESFSFKNIDDVNSKEQYRVEVSNRFVALEDLDAEVYINSALETIRENIKSLAKESLGYYEVKRHQSCFNEGCSEFLAQRK